MNGKCKVCKKRAHDTQCLTAQTVEGRRAELYKAWENAEQACLDYELSIKRECNEG